MLWNDVHPPMTDEEKVNALWVAMLHRRGTLEEAREELERRPSWLAMQRVAAAQELYEFSLAQWQARCPPHDAAYEMAFAA